MKNIKRAAWMGLFLISSPLALAIDNPSATVGGIAPQSGVITPPSGTLGASSTTVPGSTLSGPTTGSNLNTFGAPAPLITSPGFSGPNGSVPGCVGTGCTTSPLSQQQAGIAGVNGINGANPSAQGGTIPGTLAPGVTAPGGATPDNGITPSTP